MRDTILVSPYLLCKNKKECVMFKFTSFQLNDKNEFTRLEVRSHLSFLFLLVTLRLTGNLCDGIHCVYFISKEIEIIVFDPFHSAITSSSQSF